MNKSKTPWIIAYDATKGADAYALECLRCGAKQRFVVPINVDVWVAAGKAFCKIHRKCKEQKP